MFKGTTKQTETKLVFDFLQPKQCAKSVKDIFHDIKKYIYVTAFTKVFIITIGFTVTIVTVIHVTYVVAVTSVTTITNATLSLLSLP